MNMDWQNSLSSRGIESVWEGKFADLVYYNKIRPISSWQDHHAMLLKFPYLVW